jgi:hypothetical protein
MGAGTIIFVIIVIMIILVILIVNGMFSPSAIMDKTLNFLFKTTSPE